MSLPQPDSEHAVPAAANSAVRQLALQAASAFAVLSLAWPYFLVRSEPLPWPQTAFAIGAVALLAAWTTRQPWWWRLIHAAFAPLAAGVATLGIDPGWFLVAFMATLLVYRGAITGRIPLYLSNRTTAKALAHQIPTRHGARFVDLGAGIGSVVCRLARLRPDAQVVGVENAPATWLVGRLRTYPLRNCEWQWKDLWGTDLATFDIAYAFLSPAPMAELWRKVESEMKPGSVFISNSFPVPGRDPDDIIEVDDARRTRLYCYRR